MWLLSMSQYQAHANTFTHDAVTLGSLVHLQCTVFNMKESARADKKQPQGV